MKILNAISNLLAKSQACPQGYLNNVTSGYLSNTYYPNEEAIEKIQKQYYGKNQ